MNVAAFFDASCYSHRLGLLVRIQKKHVPLQFRIKKECGEIFLL